MGDFSSRLILFALLLSLIRPEAARSSEKTISFRDPRIQMELRYHEGTAWVGTDKHATIVTDGVLSLISGGRTRKYSPAELGLPPGHWQFKRPGNDCGANGPGALGRRGDYAFIVVVYFGKGCAPTQALIELSRGHLEKFSCIYHRWFYRHAARPPVFRSYLELRVNALSRLDFPVGPVSLIQTRETDGARKTFLANEDSAAGMRVGQALSYGTLGFSESIPVNVNCLRYDAQSEHRFEDFEKRLMETHRDR